VRISAWICAGIIAKSGADVEEEKEADVQNKKALINLSKLVSDPDWIRTNDPQLRRLMLYPTELPDRNSAANIGQ
jgi:hypothetical protein